MQHFLQGLELQHGQVPSVRHTADMCALVRLLTLADTCGGNRYICHFGWNLFSSLKKSLASSPTSRTCHHLTSVLILALYSQFGCDIILVFFAWTSGRLMENSSHRPLLRQCLLLTLGRPFPAFGIFIFVFRSVLPVVPGVFSGCQYFSGVLNNSFFIHTVGWY